MARVQGDDLILEPQGRLLVHVDGATVTYTEVDGVTPLTIYADPDALEEIAQPLTSIHGRVEPVGGGDWWHDPQVRVRHATHPDGRVLPSLRQEAYSAVDAGRLTAAESSIAVVKESPLNILDDRFGGDNTGVSDNASALEAVDDYLGSFGAEVIYPPGEYLHTTDPVITKPGVTLRGVGKPEIQLEKIIVRADDFKASDLRFVPRAGATDANVRPINVDPVGAGRTLTGIRLQDIDFEDCFYAVDLRGDASFGVKRVRLTNLMSDRVLAGNAGHFQFVYCEDVTTMGLGSYGGAEAASQNFFQGSGAITVIGGADKDNDSSGGALNFENFASSAKVTVLGGQWGWGISSGTDAYAITCDDVEDITIIGVDCGGYIRVTTSSGIVRRVKIADSSMTRFRAADTSGGTPLYIDELDFLDNTIRGVPGVAAAYGMFVDGTYVRKGRLLGNRIRRYQANNATENWTDGAIGVVNAANLDLEIDNNDCDGRPVVASGSGGVIYFGQRNRNVSSITGVTRAPTRVPTKAGVPADADYTAALNASDLVTGLTVVDRTNMRVYSRVGTDDWRYAPMANRSTQTIATDANFTLTPWTSAGQTFHTGVLTANRTVTLSIVGAVDGQTFKIKRTGGGAFTLNVGVGPLKALATGQWAEFTFNGLTAAWELGQFGSL